MIRNSPPHLKFLRYLTDGVKMIILCVNNTQPLPDEKRWKKEEMESLEGEPAIQYY